MNEVYLTDFVPVWHNYCLQEPEYRIRDKGYKIQDAEYRILDKGYRIQDKGSGYRIKDTAFYLTYLRWMEP